MDGRKVLLRVSNDGVESKAAGVDWGGMFPPVTVAISVDRELKTL